MARKGENIHKRKDGRWEGRYIKARSAEGKALYGYVYGKSYAEAKLAKQKAEAAGTRVCPTFLLKHCCALWLAYIQQRVKESTYVKYYRICEKYIASYFSKPFSRPISEADVDHFSSYLLCKGGKNAAPLAPKTVADILLILKEVLSYCDSRALLQFKAAISLPKQKKQASAVLSYEEQRRLIQVLMGNNDNTSMGILISMYTGIRIGELCALRWEDINFEYATIRIARSVTRIQNIDTSAAQKTKLKIDTPKTQSSERTIPLSKTLNRFLEERRQAGNHYILTGSTRLMEPRCLYARYKKIIKSCNLHDYTFHALRHTFATRCVESGVDVKSLSEILGHADVRITLNRYVHPSLEVKRRELEKLTIYACFE